LKRNGDDQWKQLQILHTESFSPYCDKHKTWQKTVKASNKGGKTLKAAQEKINLYVKQNYIYSIVTLIPF
jgi:hypothetical protein